MPDGTHDGLRRYRPGSHLLRRPLECVACDLQPSLLEDAGVDDASAEDAHIDDAGTSGWEELAALPLCDAEQAPVEAGEACEEPVDCIVGGCVLDWASRHQCKDGEWRIRHFGCWTDTWGQWMTGEDDAGAKDNGGK